MTGWRNSLAVYSDRRMLIVLVMGFASGLPLALTASTLSVWLTSGGISLKSIGLFALVGLPYNLKILWAPLIDRVPPPLPLGRRRGWGLTIQAALMVALLVLGGLDPQQQLGAMMVLATVVAFLSASQDIVIDAYRVELLEDWQQGAGASATQIGYRLGTIVAGAGALFAAQEFGWFAAYAIMAACLLAGSAVFLFAAEPVPRVSPETIERERRAAAFLESRPHLQGHRARVLAWLHGAMVSPFVDFMTRPRWLAVLVMVFGYKLGEAMAGGMASPLYVTLGFTPEEIGTVSKIFGVFATIGGVLVARLGSLRALLLCGLLQSLGNLAYVLQVQAGHDIAYLALCIFAENVTGGMAGAAMVAYLSGLCNQAYTATQYAMLSSVAALGRTLVASSSGLLVQSLGWVPFFLMTTVITLPALGLLVWLMGRAGPNRRDAVLCGAPSPSEGLDPKK